MRKTAIAFLCMFPLRTAFAADVPQTLPGGLIRVPNAKVALAYVRPGTDWSKYKTIQLLALSVPSTVRNTAPPGVRPEFGQSYILPDKSVTALRKAYDEITREELGKGGLRFVNTPRADTLIVAAQVMNIQLNAPVEDLNMGPRSATFTRSSGSMILAVAFADGGSGQVIAEAEDRKVSSDMWRYNTSAENMAQARTAFHDWARLLRQRLASP